jgi:hypothetical protein
MCCWQLVQTRTVEAFNSKLEQKKVEFVKLREENATCKSALAETQSTLEVRFLGEMLDAVTKMFCCNL